MKAGKSYMFSCFIDGIGKVFFTLIPFLLLFFGNIFHTNDPMSTRISLLISTLSLMFFYLVEYIQTVSRRVKLEIAIFLTFLIGSFILNLAAFYQKEIFWYDYVAVTLFAVSLMPIFVESILTFIFVDYEYQRRAKQKKKRRIRVRSWMNIRAGENS